MALTWALILVFWSSDPQYWFGSSGSVFIAVGLSSWMSELRLEHLGNEAELPILELGSHARQPVVRGC